MKNRAIALLFSIVIAASSLNAVPVYAGGTIKLSIKTEGTLTAEEEKDAKTQIGQAVASFIPSDLIKYFTDHHGTIYIGNWDGARYTNFAVTPDNKPMIPDTCFKDYPLDMHISIQDAKHGFLDDYVLHEFGHVFDARYGITRNPQYDAIIASEIPAILMAMVGNTTNDMSCATTPEAFAQVYAAYKGGNGIVGSPAILKAAPYTVGIIQAYEAYEAAGGNVK